MKKNLLLFLLLIVAEIHASAQGVNWNRPKYVMSCVMEPKPMVKDTIGVYEYYGDSVVIYHKLDMLRDKHNRKVLSGGEPYRIYKAFDTLGNITAEILYCIDTIRTTRFVNTYDTLGRLMEVAQSDGVTRKYYYRRKHINELVSGPGNKKELISHHYKNKDYTLEKRTVYWEGDFWIADRVRYKYDSKGRLRKTLYEGDKDSHLYKRCCKFVTEKVYNGYAGSSYTKRHHAIIYESI